MTNEVALISVEVAYALPERQWLRTLQVPPGTTLYEAVQRSGLPEACAFALETAVLGVFGKVEPEPRKRVLLAGERAEIYRPLLTDPKDARKARAARVRGAAGKA